MGFTGNKEDETHCDAYVTEVPYIFIQKDTYKSHSGLQVR
jgi:hypothetical protein